MSNIILVVSPHPDDETLGCGGSLLRHVAEGDIVHWLIMTRMTEESGYTKKAITIREKEINLVSESYGFASVTQSPFSTTELDTISKKFLIDVVSNAFHEIMPDIVYVPYRNDVHSDHKVVFDVVAACVKSFRYPYVKKVLAYETLSETEFSVDSNNLGFRPNLWVNISDYLSEKIRIMSLYKGEIQQHPFPRSERNIRALATLRGATAGCDSAESFIILKEIL